MKKIFSVFLLLLALVGLSTNAEAAWFDTYVAKGVEHSVITAGFQPREGLTRGDALRMLKAAETHSYCFTVEEARQWAIAEGISDGDRMGDYLTRAEGVTMLGRFCDADPIVAQVSYPDILDIPYWSYPYVCWATKFGILNGMEDGNLRPNDKLAGSHMLKMLSIVEGW